LAVEVFEIISQPIVSYGLFGYLGWLHQHQGRPRAWFRGL
jgi:hypothetical protein